MPSTRTAQKWIEESYENEKSKLVQEMKESPSKISFKVDGWTSKSKHAFQGVVATWIDLDWNYCTCFITMDHLKGTHSGSNLYKSFCDMLDRFNWWEKFLALTADNATNMNTLALELEETCQTKGIAFTAADYRVRCLAHIIYLTCKAILSAIGVTDIKETAIEKLEDES